MAYIRNQRAGSPYGQISTNRPRARGIFGNYPMDESATGRFAMTRQPSDNPMAMARQPFNNPISFRDVPTLLPGMAPGGYGAPMQGASIPPNRMNQTMEALPPEILRSLMPMNLPPGMLPDISRPPIQFPPGINPRIPPDISPIPPPYDISPAPQELGPEFSDRMWGRYRPDRSSFSRR